MNFLNTDDNGSDTREHRSRTKVVDNFEYRRADALRSRRHKHQNANDMLVVNNKNYVEGIANLINHLEHCQTGNEDRHNIYLP
eukprot:65305-Heterocapsa_arctica.AAC.1